MTKEVIKNDEAGIKKRSPTLLTHQLLFGSVTCLNLSRYNDITDDAVIVFLFYLFKSQLQEEVM